MTDPHWRVEVKPDGKRFKWRLLHALGLNPNTGPWIESDTGRADTVEAAFDAARAAFDRIMSAEPPGVRVDW